MPGKSGRKFDSAFAAFSLAVLAARVVINAEGRSGDSQGVGVGVSDAQFVPGQAVVPRVG